ncbi:MAG TPA: hypothetical protein VGE57_09465 [Solimonas sp.]
MTTPPRRKRDWLEPPDWWKKWRPLRWLAALLIVLAVVSWLPPLFGPDPAASSKRALVTTPGNPLSDDPDGEVALVPEEALEAAIVKKPPAPSANETAPTPVPAKATVPDPADAAKKAAGDKKESTDKAAVAAATGTPAAAPPASAPSPAVVPAPTPAAPPAVVVESEEEDEVLTRLEAQQTRDYRAFTERLPNPVPLIAKFRSYSSVDAVHTALVAAKYEPIQESNHARPRKDAPPRNLDLLRVRGYRHLGVEGVLELQFFNDRLLQAEFEPGDAEAYRTVLRRSMPQLPRERSGRSEFRDGALRVASNLDLAVSEVGGALRTRPFVLWQDQRLIQQRDSWDQRFGPKPAP